MTTEVPNKGEGYQFSIRGISRDQHRLIKVMAAQEGLTLGQLILRYLNIDQQEDNQ